MKHFFRILRSATIITAGVFFSPSASSQSIFVNDNLRVGVRAEPSTQVVPFSVVITGMKLKVLDKIDGYIKIETKKDTVIIDGVNYPPTKYNLNVWNEYLENRDRKTLDRLSKVVLDFN